MTDDPKPPPAPSAPGTIKARRADQTVCDEPAAKEKFCAGHLKAYMIADKETLARVPSGHVLFRCARCGQLYEGEQIQHLH
jgi:hypothetical protein